MGENGLRKQRYFAWVHKGAMSADVSLQIKSQALNRLERKKICKS
jgi:hypothetical protein